MRYSGCNNESLGQSLGYLADLLRGQLGINGQGQRLAGSFFGLGEIAIGRNQ